MVNAMEMPVQMMGAEDPKPSRQKGKVLDKGSETIKVPAGTFKTQHLQYRDAEGVVYTWAYKDVFPYGVIKSQSKDFEI
ncbi:MAG: hypothetical protein AB1502_15405 [Thermodesulfobacteriota bacterium]